MPHRRYRKLLTSLVALLGIATSGGAYAQTDEVGWAFVSNPGSKTPASYFNSSHGEVTVNGRGSGGTGITFSRLSDDNPNLQVSAVDGTAFCLASPGAAFASGARVDVFCYDVNGKPANEAFTLLLQRRTATFGSAERGIAYVTYTNAFTGGGVYTPPKLNQFNSTGGKNTIVSDSVGRYTVTLPGFTRRGGTVLVTAGSGAINPPQHRCKTTGWSNNGNGTKVGVACFDATGQPADDVFYLVYAIGVPLGYLPGIKTRGAYARADAPAKAGPYTPTLAYNFSNFGTGKMTVQRTGTGDYTVSLPGPPKYSTPVALVTSFGATINGNYCNLNGWFPIKVKCYNQGGIPADSIFDVVFQAVD